MESTFGCVRQMGGNNCNPNAQQFGAAYRKLLLQHEITSSNGSNCRNDLTKVLEVPSGVKSVSASANALELQMLANRKSDFSVNDDDGLISHSKAYFASELERKVKRKISLKGGKACIRCIDVFDENEKLNNIFVQFLSQKKEILQPCKSTVNIISLVDKILENFDALDVSYASMLTFILNEAIKSLSLFQSSHFGKEHDHKVDFVKLIIETYLDKKCENVSRVVTRCSQKKLFYHVYLVRPAEKFE